MDLLEQVAGVVRRVVPYRRAGWLLTDPATELHTAAFSENVDGATYLRLTEHELAGEDVLTFHEIARGQAPAASLSQVTDGELGRSTRHRTLFRPHGYGDELRAVFRTGRTVWGQACLSRGEDEPAFSREEVDLFRRISAAVGEGLRTGLLLASATTPVGDGGAPGPGVVVLADGGHAESLTAEAETLLQDAPRAGTELPTVVHEVAQRARVLADDAGGPPARARVHVPHHGWLLVHGSSLDGERTAVVVERAPRAQLAALLVDLYGLTPREQEVAGLWVRGFGVEDIARELFVSPHTVHDHVKAIYAKFRVGNRADLTATLFFDQMALSGPGPSGGA